MNVLFLRCIVEINLLTYLLTYLLVPFQLQTKFLLVDCIAINQMCPIIMAGMAVFNVAGYLIEERRRWPVITASPRGQCSK